ncbi:MAG: hypothetical protein D6717_10510 [Gammaproteobacteria bacterium]|nr:MAG: hypothetical protein D6717_10510 [Gammaproteobacteria bacterium]
MKIRRILLLAGLCLPLVSQAGYGEYTVTYKVEARKKGERPSMQKMTFRRDGNLMRQDVVSEEGHTAIIMELDGENLIMTVLDPDSKTYSRTVSKAEGDDVVLFKLPKDDSDPCVLEPDKVCKRLGTGRFKGYRVIKWQESDRDDGDTTVYWYAPKLGIFLKLVEDGDVLTAIEIDDSAPPAHYFKPPAGYRKVNPMVLMGGGAAAPGGGGSGAAAPQQSSPRKAEAPAQAGAEEADDGGNEMVEDIKGALRNLFGN